MQSKAHEPDIHETSEDDLWRPQPGRFSDDELARGMVEARCAGPACSHDRPNVLWKIAKLVAGEPVAQFGLTGVSSFAADEVLEMVAQEAGFPAEPWRRDGEVPIDPALVVAACDQAGRRLALAAQRRERVVLATGHPAGLILLYLAVGRLLTERGASLLRPARGLNWMETNRHREIRYLHGVAVLTDRAGTLHTHGAGPMEAMLERARPDLVFADHGFAGAAIEAGIDTISIADVNDPALVVAKHQGRTENVIVMDDNVQPEGYWACFQAMAAHFPAGSAAR